MSVLLKFEARPKLLQIPDNGDVLMETLVDRNY